MNVKKITLIPAAAIGECGDPVLPADRVQEIMLLVVAGREIMLLVVAGRVVEGHPMVGIERLR
jgi:hypothetical protein